MAAPGGSDAPVLSSLSYVRGQSAHEVFNALVKLPRSEWPVAVSSLPAQLKMALVKLIQSRGSGGPPSASAPTGGKNGAPGSGGAVMTIDDGDDDEKGGVLREDSYGGVKTLKCESQSLGSRQVSGGKSDGMDGHAGGEGQRAAGGVSQTGGHHCDVEMHSEVQVPACGGGSEGHGQSLGGGGAGDRESIKGEKDDIERKGAVGDPVAAGKEHRQDSSSVGEMSAGHRSYGVSESEPVVVAVGSSGSNRAAAKRRKGRSRQETAGQAVDGKKGGVSVAEISENGKRRNAVEGDEPRRKKIRKQSIAAAEAAGSPGRMLASESGGVDSPSVASSKDCGTAVSDGAGGRRSISEGGGDSLGVCGSSSRTGLAVGATEHGASTIIDMRRLYVPEGLPIADPLGKAMFVAGDVTRVASECVVLVHRYLTLWTSGLFCHFGLLVTRKLESIAQAGKGRKNSIPPERRVWWEDKKLGVWLKEFLEVHFAEVARNLSAGESFQRAASQVAATAVQTPTTDDVLNSMIGASGSPSAADTASGSGGQDGDVSGSQSYERTASEGSASLAEAQREGGAGQSSSSVAAALLPISRFDDRLRFRDLRTLGMRRDQYESFSAARDKLFRFHKTSVHEWLCNCFTAAAAYQYSADRPARPGTSLLQAPRAAVDLLIAILSDRVASVVETAIRIRNHGKASIHKLLIPDASGSTAGNRQGPRSIADDSAGDWKSEVLSEPTILPTFASLVDSSAAAAGKKTELRKPSSSTLGSRGSFGAPGSLSMSPTARSGTVCSRGSGGGGQVVWSTAIPIECYETAVTIIFDNVDAPSFGLSSPMALAGSMIESTTVTPCMSPSTTATTKPRKSASTSSATITEGASPRARTNGGAAAAQRRRKSTSSRKDIDKSDEEGEEYVEDKCGRRTSSACDNKRKTRAASKAESMREKRESSDTEPSSDGDDDDNDDNGEAGVDKSEKRKATGDCRNAGGRRHPSGARRTKQAEAQVTRGSGGESVQGGDSSGGRDEMSGPKVFEAVCREAVRQVLVEEALVPRELDVWYFFECRQQLVDDMKAGRKLEDTFAEVKRHFEVAKANDTAEYKMNQERTRQLAQYGAALHKVRALARLSTERREVVVPPNSQIADQLDDDDDDDDDDEDDGGGSGAGS